MKGTKRIMAGIWPVLLLTMLAAFPALAHTAEGTAYQNVSGTPIYYTSGVPQSKIDMAVSEYSILPDYVKNRMNQYGVLFYLYPSSMEADDDIDKSFIAVTHSGVWAWQGSETVFNLDPPWVDFHSDRMNGGTVIHETGHVMDHLYEPGNTASASRSEEFQQLYRTYKNALAGVDSSTRSNTYIAEEAYAESFRLYLTNRAALDRVSPQLSAYIERTALAGGGTAGSGSSGGSGNGGTGGSGSSSTAGGSGGPAAPPGSWILDARGWWYRFEDGSWPAETWLYWNNDWYYFDPSGYMATGWRQWHGQYYFLDPHSGAMWHDTMTPDGYYVGSDGALQIFFWW